MVEKHDASAVSTLSTQRLEALDLFRGESPERLAWALSVCRVRSLVPGDVFLEPEHDNDALYIILDGRAEVRFIDESLCSNVYLEAGECAGEMSIIEGSRPSATVVALSHCQVLIIGSGIIWSLIEQSSVIARNLLHILSRRMRRNNLALVRSQIQSHRHEREALHDALTGLKNRRWLERTLAKIIRHCSEEGLPLTLLMIDTDNFKRYNDEYGHLAGDRLLNSIACVINENIRSGDHSCRFGGDEFVAILPDMDLYGAMAIAQRICSLVRERSAGRNRARQPEEVSVSIGVASMEPGMPVKQLLDCADAALYRAKADGRDRVSC